MSVPLLVSCGKDSTVLEYVLSELKRRHNYGLDHFLLSIDEGITGYHDDSLETVKRNKVQYGLPLQIVFENSSSVDFAGIYSPNAYGRFAREFIKDLKRLRPKAFLEIIQSGEDLRIAA